MKRLGHLAIVAHDMGLIFEFLALVTLVPFIVLIIYREWEMILPMGTVPFLFLASGFLISKVPRKPYIPSLSIALVAVALTWLAAAVIGAVPLCARPGGDLDRRYLRIHVRLDRYRDYRHEIDRHHAENSYLLAIIHAMVGRDWGDCIRDCHA